MRLITYDRGGARRLGAWVGDTVVDLPEAVGHPAFPPTMEALVQHIGGSILDAAHDILEDQGVVAECAVARPSLLPPLVPSVGRIRAVTDRGDVSIDDGPGHGAGLACIVGRASRARRVDLPRSMIFGYTLIVRWPAESDGGSATRLGPCIMTPDELDERGLCLSLTIDGVRTAESVVRSPHELFGAAIASVARSQSLEAGDVFAWMCWSLGRPKGTAAGSPRLIELSAEGVGVLRTDRPA